MTLMKMRLVEHFGMHLPSAYLTQTFNSLTLRDGI